MHPAPPSSLSDAPSPPVPPAGLRRFLTPENGVRLAVVGLAAFLRLFWLDQRPPHFDEGVNGWFTDQMQDMGYYKYDPSNYHGPLHFYALFLFKSLFGRNLWALRLPVALVGILTVDWLFRFRAFFGRRVCALAALAMALSPSMTYFQRDAIHETWLVFFLVLAFWGLCGLWQLGGKPHLWALGMGITGAILTKETYLVHFGCFGVAVAVLWLLEENLPCAPRALLRPYDPTLEPDDRSLWHSEDPQPRFLERFQATFAPQRYRSSEVLAVVGVSFGLILFFYSGNFMYAGDAHTGRWPGLHGLFSTFLFWGNKAHEGEGHNKDFIYWLHLLLLNEPVAVAGLLACLRYIVPPLPTARFRPAGAALLAVCLGLLVFAFWPGQPFFHGAFTPADADLHQENKARLVFVGVLSVFLVGAVAALALPRPADWRLRLLAIYAPGTLLAYSLIPYKTPWCAISIIWPFFLAGAAALVELLDRYADRPAVRVPAQALAGALGALSAWWMVDLNYVRPTNERVSAAAATLMYDLKLTAFQEDNLAFAYVQTYNDMWRITEPLLTLAEHDPNRYHLRGVILCGSTYPLPWVLGDFSGIGYYSDRSKPRDYRADFLLVERRRVAEAEGQLDADYFKEVVQLRPAQEPLTLYLRATMFAPYFRQTAPDRAPEFHPGAKPEETPAETLPPEASEEDPTSPSE